jgi:hypothetical protein
MTWKASEIRTLTVHIVAVGAAVVVPGSTLVPMNMRRYILQIEAQNLFGGVNILTLAKSEIGVVTNLETFSFTLINDYVPKPDGPIREDALPLYIIDGPPTGSVLTSFLAAANSAAGVTVLTVRYVDAD